MRGLGVWGSASVVVGTVIGSGIFLVANSMTRGVGTPAAVLLVWTLAGLLSLSGALAYAELGAMMPEAGGEYVYLRQAYGPLWGFLYGWSQFLVMKTASIATLAAGFALYFTLLFPSYDLKGVAVLVVAALGAVNYLGVRTGGAVQTVFTALKVGLILALAVAALAVGGGDWSHFRTSLPVPAPVSGFVLAMVAALWAYDGWNNLSMAGGEVADPQRNIPRSLVLGTLAVALLYILANVAYFYILPAPEVAASSRVAGDVARRFLGEWGGRGVALAAMISMFAAINGSILSGARVPFAMARDGLFFAPLAAVHRRFHSPHVAVVVQTLLAAAMALTGTYEQLFTYVIFASWIYYGLTASAVFVLRHKHPEWPRPYRAWGYPILPALFVAISAILVVMTFREQPRGSLVGLGIIGLGVPAYLLWQRRARRTAVAVVGLLCLLHPVPVHARLKAADTKAGRARMPVSTAATNEVLLFALNDSVALESLRLHGEAGTTVSPQWFAAGGDGSLSGAASRALLDRCRELRMRVAPAVVNRDFSPQVAAQLLRSRRARSRLVRELLAHARRSAFSGYVIDFENLPAEGVHRRRFSAFLGELRASLRPAGLSLAVALPPPSPRQRETFDYRALGRLADRVVLMAYDQHGRLNGPGPIAGYEWVQATLRETTALVPPAKLLLGIAFYHRHWSEAGSTAGSYSEALALQRQHGADQRWDPAHRAYWFGFVADGKLHTVWVEDTRSIAEKLALARHCRLAGIAAWRLGQEDPRVWVMLREFQRGGRASATLE